MTVVETEVVSVIRQLDPIRKEPIYSSSFAHPVQVNDDMYKNLYESDKESIGNKLYSAGIVLNFKIDGKRKIPYMGGLKGI